MTLLKGDCLDLLKRIPDDSIDSIVTDPPYGLEFMGNDWDAPWKNRGDVVKDASTEGGFQGGSGGNLYSRSRIRYGRGDSASVGFQKWFTEIAAECLRVLKPGGHLLAFGGSRTYHRLACAVEDAGFEIRDQIMWVYGSGFPKSLDVSKAINKAAGVEREVLGTRDGGPDMRGGNFHNDNGDRVVATISRPETEEAKRWEGWGTALKPAHEPIVVARKPLIGTVAQNVLKYGTGALNIDGCRIPHASEEDLAMSQAKNPGRDDTVSSDVYGGGRPQQSVNEDGRWPTNLIHDGSEEVMDLFPSTSGGAARFFYCAKAATSERDEGLDGLMPGSRPTMSSGIGGQPDQRIENFRNTHPTVKPLDLMRYLVRLVTPKGGTVLDPFLGSGTTACAAILEGCEWVGCEITSDYWPIIEGRVLWAQNQPKPLFYL